MDTAPVATPPPEKKEGPSFIRTTLDSIANTPRIGLIAASIAAVALVIGIVAWIGARGARTASGNAAQLEARIAELEKRLDVISPPKPPPPPSFGPAPSTSTTAGTGTTTPGATSATAAPAVPTSDAYDIVANDKLKGKTGRLVVTFPEKSKTNGARTDILTSGTTNILRTNYGNTALEFPAGTYDVVIGGRKISGVTIEPRSDTKMRVGVVRLHGSNTTRFDIFLGTSSERLQNYFGDNEIGLPVGNYEIAVNGQRTKATIQNGVVSDL